MTRRLRIVQLIPSLVVGGAEVLATQLAQAQLTLGHHVDLVCVSHGGPLEDRLDGELAANTHIVGKQHRFDASVLGRLIALLRRLKPDVVHTHLFTSHAWGTVAARAAGVPVIMHTQHACHDDEYAYLPWVRRVLSLGVHTVVGCSSATVHDLIQRRYAPFSRTHCIENGIPLTGRPRSDLNGQPLQLVTVGRMVEVKGQRYLIDALRQVLDQGLKAHLTLIGDGDLRPDLERQCHDLGLDEHVTFTGRVSDVATHLASKDLFVLPSLSEALPMALLEAGAAGLPMLVTTGGGGPTLLEAGAGGWAVPPADAGALAARILEYGALSPAQRRALGEQTYALVHERYSIDATARAYVDLYTSAL